MGKINSLDISTTEAIVAISEGNPGALTTLMSILTRGDQIDPDSAFGGFGTILLLDSFEIYGSRVWMLYKDVCGQSLSATIGLIRARQMGIITLEKLNHAIDNYGEGLDIDVVLDTVCKRLDNFNLEV